MSTTKVLFSASTDQDPLFVINVGLLVITLSQLDKIFCGEMKFTFLFV